MLCLWLPFTDGTTKNYGLTNMDVIDYETSVYNQGKLGKCRSFVGNGYLQLSNAFGIESGKDFSCCYWIKEVSNNTLSQFRVVYQCGNLIIGHYGNKFNIYSATGNALDLDYNCDTTEWIHCCMTYQGSDNTVTIYINGVKCSTSQPKNLTGLSNTTALIGKRSSGTYLFEGYLNDFRIYNTCLSPRQVKEISKGLVCHYPLGEIDGKIGGRNLLVKTNQGKTKWYNAHADGSYSCESVNWNGINAVKMSCATPTTSWKMFMFDGLLENFDKLEAGGNYILSYDVIGNVKVGFSNLWDNNAVNSIVEKSLITILETSYGYHYTVDILLKNILTKSRQVVYLHNNLKAGESVIIVNLKLEKGNKATAYIPCPTDDPVMYDNVIYDTSGYCNNGSVSGDILWDTNTPRYKGAYDFNGTGYIYNDNLNLTTTAFTISFWIKIPSAITHQHFDFATFNDWTGEGIAIYWDTSGQTGSSGAIFGEDSNGNKIHVGVGCRGKLNEWTHFAITWDGTKVYRYSDGIKFSESDFNVVSVYHPRLWLGNSTFGDRTLENSESCMSDFRFYATALSDSDILELYQSSALVDNNGNLMLAGEVIEE